MINRVLLIGNLTRDTELSAGPATAIARMRLATNSVWRDPEGQRQESSEFHTVVAFGRTAEVCAAYGAKGRRLYVDGRLRTREYDDRDGRRRTVTEVVADTVRFLDRSPGGDEAVDRDLHGATLAEEGADGVTAPGLAVLS